MASAELELPPESLDGACYVVDDENEGDDEEKMEVHVYVVILELFSYICIIIWRILFSVKSLLIRIFMAEFFLVL